MPSRRFWIALAVGAAIGGGVVASFGPYVRGKLRAAGARYGAKVEVSSVLPTPAGVRLSGIEVTVSEVPGVRLRIERLVVPWSGTRPKQLRGGHVEAVGELAGRRCQASIRRARG